MILNVGKCVETFAYKIQQICDGIGEEGVLRIGRTKILTIVCSICQVTHNLFFFDLSIKIMLWYHWSWGVSCCDYYACFLGIQSSDMDRFRWFSWFIRACLTNKNKIWWFSLKRWPKRACLPELNCFGWSVCRTSKTLVLMTSGTSEARERKNLGTLNLPESEYERFRFWSSREIIYELIGNSGDETSNKFCREIWPISAIF